MADSIRSLTRVITRNDNRLWWLVGILLLALGVGLQVPVRMTSPVDVGPFQVGPGTKAMVTPGGVSTQSITTMTKGRWSGLGVTIASQKDRGAVHVAGVPILPDGRVYEVWKVDAAGRAEEMKVIAASQVQDIDLTLQSLRPNEQVVITEEPGPDGGPQPAGAAVLIAHSN